MNVHQLNRLVGCNFLLLFAMFVTAKTASQPRVCQEPLGMENGAILDDQITASSELYNGSRAPKSRLNLNLGGWTAKTDDANPWLQVDLGDQLTKITCVATQGTKNGWVTKYKLQYSDDSLYFQSYRKQGQSKDKEFSGNTHWYRIVYRQLNPPIRARYIRFRPTDQFHSISMRVELFGSKESSLQAATTTTSTTVVTSAVSMQLQATTQPEARSSTTINIATSCAIQLTPTTDATTSATTTTTTTSTIATTSSSSSSLTRKITSATTPSTTTTTGSSLTATLSTTTASLLTSTTPTTTEAPSTKPPSENAKKLREYVSAIKALNVTNKGSLQVLNRYYSLINALNVSDKDFLQNAANTTCHFIEDLKNGRYTKHNINALVLTQILELFAINYSKVHLNANESMDTSAECLVVKIQRVPVINKEAITFSVDETDYFEGRDRASISLPSAIFKKQASFSSDAVVVSILYHGIKPIPDEQHVKLDGKTFTNLELRSPIIASTVDPRPDDILQENVTISFHYGQELKRKNIAVCVFWNFTLKSKFNGSWSIIGCSLVKIVDKEIICTCNHLTNFAVLMQVGDNKVPSDHKMALEIITYVGCAMSLVGELLTVIAYCALMDLKEVQIQIRFNLVVAIAIAQVTFLAGIDASEIKGVCVFVAALIHYFYLAGFAWILFEGVYLYLMVVKVFNTEVRMRLFYAVAWGLPLLIVLLSIVIASSQDGGVHGYVRGDFCWVSFINNLIWTFVTPVLVVCLINTVILALVIHEILTMQADKAPALERIRQGVKACVVLSPLLGMTWVFGVLSVTDAGLAFQYIFTILNSLQGLFIFILHVLRNGDVRAAYSRKKQKWKQGNSIGATYAANHNSKDLSLKVIKETEDWKSKHGKASIRSSVGLGSTVAMRQERYMIPVDT